MECEADPLDEYMDAIEEQVATLAGPPAKTATSKPSKQPSPAAAGEDSSALLLDDEEADAEEGAAFNEQFLAGTFKDMSVDEIIALVQKKAKRKDVLAIDHATIRYAPFRKDFYVESPEVSRMSEEQVVLLREHLDGIKIRGHRCPRPVTRWTQCGLDQKILGVIKKCAFEAPTPIQAQAIPAIMSGRDIIGIAKTGSGKTVAFILPMIRHILDQAPLAINDGPIALIMTPTRELAMQTFVECKRYAKVVDLRVVCAYGGVPIKDQIGDLKRGAEVLICTPGRFIDLLLANSGKVANLRRVTYLVLDEADRMFDMGFGPQVLKIVANIRPDRQAVLFSATFPQNMEALARKILKRPLEIVAGTRSSVSADVEQIVVVLQEQVKFAHLLQVLGQWYESKTNRILIFVDRQDAADVLLKELIRKSYHCNSLHGGKDQADRDCAIDDFKAGNLPILIATSVAARGLDVKDLKLVINYECPNHMEDYVHRVGRTGRAGNKGTAITFITDEQERYAPEIVKALTISKQAVPAELQALSDAFTAKIKSGAQQSVGSGFGGKGLERLDEEHARAKRTQKILMGGESDEESDSEATTTGKEGDGGGRNGKAPHHDDEHIKKVLSQALQQAAPGRVGATDEKEAAGSRGGSKAAGEALSSGPGRGSSSGSTRPSSKEAGMAEEALRRVRQVSESIVSAITAGRPSLSLTVYDPVAQVNARYSTAAARVTSPPHQTAGPLASAAVVGGPSAGASGAPTTAKGEIVVVYERIGGSGGALTPKSYYTELEINDFPQAARYRVTHKDALSAVMDFSQALISVKGEFVPPNKSAREGQRRLFIRIDSHIEANVERALKEVRRIIFDAMSMAAERGALDFHRYNL